MLMKRIFDIVVSVVLIILALPIMALIILLLKFDSFGSVIFQQTRIGVNRRRDHAFEWAGTDLPRDKRKKDLGGRPFNIYKFRSMVHDAEGQLPSLVNLEELHEPVYKLRNDPRVTSVGRFLRKSSLDELPQLFNVLKGDMSLVGPRPEAKTVVYLYNEEHKKRLRTKPGLTGLQQVKCRGTNSMNERLKYDLYYIRRRSILLDFRIMFQTIAAVLFMKGEH